MKEQCKLLTDHSEAEIARRQSFISLCAAEPAGATSNPQEIIASALAPRELEVEPLLVEPVLIGSSKPTHGAG